MSVARLPPPPDGGDAGERAESVVEPVETTPRVEDLSPGQLFDLICAGPDLDGEGPLAGVTQLVAINRLTSWLTARKLAVVADLAPFTDPEDAAWAERNVFFTELQVACRIGEGTARTPTDPATVEPNDPDDDEPPF